MTYIQKYCRMLIGVHENLSVDIVGVAGSIPAAPTISSYDINDDLGDEGDRLSQLIPLRGEIAHGDFRTLYLVWLMAVEDGHVDGAEIEPLPGIAPLSPPLRAFAEFFGMDLDLVAAAAAEAVTKDQLIVERGAAE